MAYITPLPPLVRTASTFKTDVDTFFATLLPQMVTEINAALTLFSAATNGGGFSIGYVFDSTTANSDPGSGKLRLDNATQNAATTIRADILDSGATDWSTILDSMSASTSTVKGQIKLNKLTDGTKWIAFNVTAVANPGGYRNISVTVAGSSGATPFTNGDALMLSFVRTGDKGDTGAAGMDSSTAIQFTFDGVSQADSDPGAGKLRLSSATQNTSTIIRTDLLDKNGTDMTAFLDTFDSSSSVVKGHVRLSKLGSPANFILCALTARAAPSGYRNFTISVVSSSGANPFADGDTVVLTYSRTGDTGASGGTGFGLVTTTASNVTLTSASYRVQNIATTVKDITVALPDATTLTTGGELFTIKNSGEYPFTVIDATGTRKLVVMPDQVSVWWLPANADAAGTWCIGNANVDGSSFLPYINSNAVAYSSAALPSSSMVRGCAMDSTHLLLAYIDNGASKLYCVVGTITSNYTLSFGSPVDCGSTNVYAAGGFDIDGMGSNKAIVIYANGGTGQVEARIITVSGTVPTPNTAKTLYGSGANCCAVKAIGTGAALAIVSSTGALHISYLSAASTTITEPSTYTQSGATSSSFPRISYINSTSGFISYKDTTSNFAMGAVVAISGTTVTGTTPAQMSSGSATYVSHCVVNADKALVAFDGVVNVATLTTGAAVAGTQVTIKSGSPTWGDILWANGKAVLTYTNASGYLEQSFAQFANYAQTKVRAMGDINEYNTTASAQIGTALINNNKMLTTFRNGSSTFANVFLEDLVS